MKLYHSKDFLK